MAQNDNLSVQLYGASSLCFDKDDFMKVHLEFLNYFCFMIYIQILNFKININLIILKF